LLKFFYPILVHKVIKILAHSRLDHLRERKIALIFKLLINIDMKNMLVLFALFLFAKNTFSQDIAVGKFYQGGIIFYLDSINHYGLIAAPSDINPEIPPNQAFPFCIFPLPKGSTIVTDTIIGSGRQNCLAILAVNPNLVLGTVTPVNSTTSASLNSSVKICDIAVINGYDDWYLPARNELRLMYFLRDIIGNFNTSINGSTVYGSSSQVAAIENLGNGASWDVQFNYVPTNPLIPFLRPDSFGTTIIVRPIRTFYFQNTGAATCSATCAVFTITKRRK
jgi:hypothetical protein